MFIDYELIRGLLSTFSKHFISRRFRILVFLKALRVYTLAILVLASNLGISFSTHYCGGKAVLSSFTIANQELDCGMPIFGDVDADKEGLCIYGTPCCETVRSLFDVADNYQLSQELSAPALSSIKDVLPNLHLFKEARFIQSFRYDRGPPLHVSEYLSLIQVFII